MKCQICNSERLAKFLSLGEQPVPDVFLTKEQLNDNEDKYPLDVYFCEDCCLVQLGHAVDPEVLFREYHYNTATNESLKRNFKQLVESLVKKFNLSGNDLAVDIGSNDGTLLSYYIPYKVKILGIDPSSVADIAIKNNIPTIKDFFNEKTAEKIANQHGKAKAITATNVFAHVRDFDSFMNGVKRLLSDDGVFVTESHYLMNMIKEMQYDSIYHEHLRYYSLKPLMRLFERFGMEIFDAERITTHGGSIRVYACYKDSHKISQNVSEITKTEEEEGLYDKQTFFDYGEKVSENKTKLQQLLSDLKKKNKRIVGIGAPAKGNTLLNYCNITTDIMDYIAETSELKISKFTPGMHIPVVPESKLFNDQPGYALLLSWNIKDILIPKLRGAGYKGKFIVPNPIPKII
ncbi:methyltransferase [Candidatus Woesearchaeota archaeon]|jgi:SAM-dependent methyltransferase|nr:methyltransferase [Candidatus Woesearchaeota archaeon]MDP6647827.1 class I SAM-dependent methyltransferase [Candidatus Woesearchaeota archaeon]|tara:strand:+ start:1506 stop:2717 length:1212 start_codon:yes stop_codon:yes gene_type:complete